MEESPHVKKRRTMRQHKEELGKRIARLQKRLRLSDAYLAGMAETRPSELKAIKEGTRSVSTFRARLLADALGVTTDELIPQ
jgi:transcriptional regulator with XRE-family HTH domain